MRSGSFFRLGSVVIAISLVAVPMTSLAAKTGGDDKLICKRQMKTGTRFPTKTCHSKAQWDQIQEQNRREFKDILVRPMIETRRG